MSTIGTPELLFLLRGLGWTLALTAVGFVGGIAFEMVVALIRVARRRWLRTIAAAWIAIFQGTPLLMQLFVVYFGLPLVGLEPPAWGAVAIALTAHASAYLGEIWRGAIQAVLLGQSEAAHALMSGQVDAVGGNQFYIDRIEAGAPGKFENKMPLTALYNGVGTRLDEADWNQTVNAFLTEFMATDEFKGIYNTWMKMDPPQLPAEMEGVPFTIAQ